MENKIIKQSPEVYVELHKIRNFVRTNLDISKKVLKKSENKNTKQKYIDCIDYFDLVAECIIAEVNASKMNMMVELFNDKLCSEKDLKILIDDDNNKNEFNRIINKLED